MLACREGEFVDAHLFIEQTMTIFTPEVFSPGIEVNYRARGSSCRVAFLPISLTTSLPSAANSECFRCSFFFTRVIRRRLWTPERFALISGESHIHRKYMGIYIIWSAVDQDLGMRVDVTTARRLWR
jgi:hypothetical protein